MNRTDLLTDQLIDGTLTDDEAGELETLISTDPIAEDLHLAAVRLELVLRGLRTEFDLAGPIVSKIENDRVERTTTAVMAKLVLLPTPKRNPQGRRLRFWGTFTAICAVMLVAVWLGLRTRVNTEGSRVAPVETNDFARLTSMSGSVEVVGPSGESTALLNQLLSPNQTIRTIGEESNVVVEFPDRTRVEVHPDSIVRFGPEPTSDPARKLSLVQGGITVVADGGRLVVGAGTAEVESSQGSFSLWSAGLGAVRVESGVGDVRVSRGTSTEPMIVGAGHSAFVSNQQVSLQIEKTGHINKKPFSQLDFKALDVRFTDDNQVIAVSAKHWTKWKPGTPDPGRTIFPPKTTNDGNVACLTSDRNGIAMSRSDDRVDRVVVRDLPSGTERGSIPVRVSEPRFLCIAPNASWIATGTSQKPQNRWVRIWDVAKNEERFSFELDSSVISLTASPDGRMLAVALTDQIVAFDPNSGKKLFVIPTSRKGLYCLAFSADGKRLAAGFNGAVQLWNLPDRKLIRTIEGFEQTALRLAFSPSADLIGVGTQDGRVWVWSTETGQRTQILETGTHGVRSLAFSQDGKFLVTATNKAPVAVWEIVPEQTHPPKKDF